MTKQNLLLIEQSQSIFDKDQIDLIEEKFNLTHVFGNLESSNLTLSDFEVAAIDPDPVDWNLDVKILERFTDLQKLHIPTSSFGWIDLDYCKKNKVDLTTVQNYCTDSAAEYLVMAMLMLSRKIPLIEQNEMKNEFTSKYMGQNITGKTIGIIGLGNIGNRLGELCDSFGMKVIYWSANSVNKKFEKVEVNEIFEKADFVIPCLASNSETKKIITDKLISGLNCNQFLLTISKGCLNHELAIKLVEQNKIGGYAFDFEDSSQKYNGNVLSLPEYAWYTKESTKNVATIWLNNILH
jgi:phosphoglycerate dehydrogenase-like enzyme